MKGRERKPRERRGKHKPPSKEPPRQAPLPFLGDLHQRHRGVTPAVCANFAEAASVCLSRHHAPPLDMRLTFPANSESVRAIEWVAPDERVRAAWNNRDDATRDAAYGVSLAAIEAELGLLAYSRAETLTGADYYIAPPGPLDLETIYRLEISGTDEGTESTVLDRVTKKILQTRRGESNRPAMVAVVGFKTSLVVLARVDDG